MSLLNRLRALWKRGKLESDLDEELQFHVEMKTRENVEAGMPPDKARAAALRQFGNVARTKEKTRTAWTLPRLETFVQDLRYGLRQLRRNPGFTAVAILTLALGIGANTAIFTLINTLMLHMLPVHEPEHLVELLHKYPGEPRMNGFSKESYEHFRDNNHVFSGLVGFSPFHSSLRGEGFETETVDGQYVTGNFFPVLGVQPALGRLIRPDDDRVGAAESAVAVVSWDCWKSRFNQDPRILGRKIIVDGVPLTVSGVAPRGFSGLAVWSKPEIWVPVALGHPSGQGGPKLFGAMPLNLVGRLKPGVSIKPARAEMSVLFQFTIREITRHSKDPLWRQARMQVAPAGAGMAFLRDHFKKPLMVLMAVVTLLLLIACTSIASMLVARAATRQHEMAVRVCLGAGRFRLVRQVLTESLLLSTAGGLAGLFLAQFAAGALVGIITSGRRIAGLPPHLEIQVRPDFHVLLFVAGTALLTTLLFGLAPAWSAFVSAPAPSLGAAGRASETKVQRFFGNSLVVAQVALSVVLLSAAGLFVGYLENLDHLDLGFRKDHLLLVTLDPSQSSDKPEQLSQLYQGLLGRLDALPGVRSATLCRPVPISGAGAASFVNVEGVRENPGDRRYVSLAWVAPKYFQTLDTPLVAGRDFTPQDQQGARVAIINRAMAQYYFPGGNPIGKHFTLERDWKGFGPDQPFEIVGVVGDAHYYGIREAPPRTIYFDAFGQGNVPPNSFILRTAMAPTVAAPAVRGVVREMLKGVRVERVTTMADQVDASIVPERVIALLSGTFGALGALLAAIGLFGLLAYTVARRTREIGIRMALGAKQSDMVWMVARDALLMLAAGVAIGTPLVFWARTFALNVLEGLPARSPVPIVFGIGAMTLVALAASYIPARRATKVDPMIALRYE
jgi:putative ABC transport system permease protein